MRKIVQIQIFLQLFTIFQTGTSQMRFIALIPSGRYSNKKSWIKLLFKLKVDLIAQIEPKLQKFKYNPHPDSMCLNLQNFKGAYRGSGWSYRVYRQRKLKAFM